MDMQEWINWIVPIGTVLAALISARASKVSANAARRSNAAAFAALEENRKIAQNDWRIRLMDERMKVWNAFEVLMGGRNGFWSYSTTTQITAAEKAFEYSKFLFVPEVDDFFNTLINKVKRHTQLTEKHQYAPALFEEVDPIEAQELQALSIWISSQKIEGKKLLSKHMSLID